MNSVIGTEVRRSRLLSGLSQAAIGKILGLSQAAVYAIERGERNLRWEEGILLRAAIGFDTDVDDSIVRDAIAYRRILSVIGEREAGELELEQVSA